MSSQHKAERDVLSARLGVRSTYEGFLRVGGQKQAAELWRYRNSPEEAAFATGDGTEELIRRDIRDFDMRVEHMAGKSGVFIAYYAHTRPEALSFADRGKRIDIYQASDQAAVLAALQLGSQKWGVLTITGPAEFQLLCAELAKEHGFCIQNIPLATQLPRASGLSHEVDGQSLPPTPY